MIYLVDIKSKDIMIVSQFGGDNMQKVFGQVYHDWQHDEIVAIMAKPLMELLYLAQSVHRQHFNPNQVQTSQLLSIKTGACPEDCKYCSQSGHNQAKIEKEKLLDIEKIITAAKTAKQNGASRFCMGAAWRNPPAKQWERVINMVAEVKALGLETCMTLGMLSDEQARQLGDAGLDYYNHNLDTSPEYYDKITTTRCYQDRLDTLQRVRDAGIKVCCGGILGMGETRDDRASFLRQLANLSEHPESAPMNMLIPVAGTPFQDKKPLPPFEFIRTIATARIILPKSVVRLSAGREKMTEELQALCFFAGANSIFLGDTLLTAANPELDNDQQLLEKLGLEVLVLPQDAKERAFAE
jgi:biotin synthase